MLSMPRGYSFKIIGATGIIVGACIFVLVGMPGPAAHNSAVPTAVTQEQRALAGVPVNLAIPGIGVDAPIDPMGVLPGGDMEAPAGGANTGWYKLGPHPGNVGSAVIAGHYGRWKTGETSVFDKLHTLKPGDKVMVRDDAGQIITFVVRETQTFGRDADARAIFTSNDGKAHLNLITCQGAWNESQKTYADRLVVFTDKE